MIKQAMELLPTKLRGQVCERAEEIRLRLGKRVSVVLDGKEQAYSQETVTEEDILRVLEKATGASVHSAINSMREGYIMSGALRIGICGHAITQEGRVTGFSKYTSLAIRIPGEHAGICTAEARELLRRDFRGALIVSPPGGGKTTALRDIVRVLSNEGMRVSVADERGEISSGFELGAMTDTLFNIPKAEAAVMLLRAMTPEAIAFDEITKPEDACAVKEIAGCGVKLIATVHGGSVNELSRRENMRELLEAGIFDYAVLIYGTGSQRRYSLTQL